MISDSNIAPVSTIGVLKDENLATYYTKNAYDYTVKDGSSADGTLKMVSDSVYPGCFMYNKAVAMDVLGTDDPDEVQKYINDWDGFYAVAEKAKTAGYTMTSGSDQVIKDKLNRSDIYNELLTKGYETGHKTWDDEWYADRNSGKIFGFFADPSMLWMLEDSQLDKYDMCIAPCAYVYGGVYYASNNACKDNPLVAQILYTLTCDADAMGAVCKSGNGDMVNNQTAVKQQAADKTPIDRYMGDDASLWKRWDTYAARVGNDTWLANKLSYGNYAVKVDATNSFSISEIGNGFDSRFLEPITISAANNVKAVMGTGNNTVVTVYDTDHVVKYNYTIGSTTYTLQFAPYKEDTITASIVENETQLESGAILVQSVTLENGGITGKQAETIYGTSENQVVLTEAKDGTGTVVKEADVAVKQNSLDSDTVKTAMDVVEQKNAEYNGDKYTNASIGEVNAVFSDDADKNVANAVFDSLKKQNIKLTLSKETNTGNEYTWTFESADISEPVSLKTGIKVETLDETIKTLIPEDKDDCMFDFAQEGILPGKATVAVNVADLNLSSDESLYCYYYDEDKGELLEGQPVTVDENGNVAIEIEHCCKYVVTSAKIAELVNKVEIVVPESKVLNVGDTLNLSVTITPETATNKSITWTSSDDAIATVDESTGMVTAKSTGTVTIKATAKDGSKKFDEIELSIVAKECKHENTEIRNAKEASCTEAGYTGDTYCVDCNQKLKTGEVITKKEHTSSDWIVDKAATVEAEGSRHKECTVCKTVLAKEAIAKLPSPTPTPEPVVTPDVTIRYTTHVQTFGWQGDENNASKWFVNGKMAGTSGKAKRLEGIKIRVYGNDNLGIQYTTHCQSYGWLPWSANGEMNGTEGEAKRLEAIKIQLTGTDKDKYDVYYRVHAQSYGWLGWAKNGAPSGTAGYAKRLEGIQIVVVKKGAAALGLNYAGVNAASGVHQTASYVAKAGSSPVVGNQATSNTNPSVAGEANVNVAYRTHVQTFGWQGWKYNGQMSGTSGQAKRLEGINIKLTNKPYSGSIVYTTHVQTYGWQGNENNPNTWRRDGDMSGTSGEAKRLEAIRIALTGEMAEHYDVYYCVHAQSFGWLGWAKNGEAAGTAGLAKRLEGIQIVLVPKGGNAPARSYQGITSVKTQAYIKK